MGCVWQPNLLPALRSYGPHRDHPSRGVARVLATPSTYCPFYQSNYLPSMCSFICAQSNDNQIDCQIVATPSINQSGNQRDLIATPLTMRYCVLSLSLSLSLSRLWYLQLTYTDQAGMTGFWDPTQGANRRQCLVAVCTHSPPHSFTASLTTIHTHVRCTHLRVCAYEIVNEMATNATFRCSITLAVFWTFQDQ